MRGAARCCLRASTLAMASTFFVTFSARAACPVPFGDLTGEGLTNVVDVQCSILSALQALIGASPPPCLAGPASVADANCDATINVVDVQLVVTASLGAPFNAQIDANANACPDACEAGCAGDCGAFANACPGPPATAATAGLLKDSLAGMGNDSSADSASCPSAAIGGGPSTNGPDAFVTVSVPPGAWLAQRVVLGGYDPRAYWLSACGSAQATCYASSLANAIPVAANALSAPLAGRKAAVVAEVPGGGGELRLVADTPPAPEGGLPDGALDLALSWRVLTGPPLNNLPQGALPLMSGEPAWLEIAALATSAFEPAECPLLDSGTFAGTPDLFYSFEPPASGPFLFEAQGLNVPQPVGGSHFLALLGPDGECLAARRGGPLSLQVDLQAGQPVLVVLDAGKLPKEAAFDVAVSPYVGPANADCTKPWLVPWLPYQTGGTTAGASNAFHALGSGCSALLPSIGGGAGAPDVAYQYLSQGAEWVKVTLASLDPSFAPTLVVTGDCGGAFTQGSCMGGFEVPPGGSASQTLLLPDGEPVWFVVDGTGSSTAGGPFLLTFEPAEPAAPDTCALAQPVPEAPGIVELSGMGLSDQFVLGGAAGAACGTAGSGGGRLDAVLRYTAPAAGVLEVTDLTPDSPVVALYGFVGWCAGGSALSCDSLSPGPASTSLLLDAGETAWVVVDGWLPDDPFQTVTLAFDLWPLPSNDVCTAATSVPMIPFDHTANLAFSGNDHAPGSCPGLSADTGGADVLFALSAAQTSSALVAGVLAASFPAQLYALSACAGGSANCAGGADTQAAPPDNLLALPPQNAPTWLVVDHPSGSAGGSFHLRVASLVPPPNDTCPTAQAIPLSLPFVAPGSTLLANNDVQIPMFKCNAFFGAAAGPDVVWRLDVTDAWKAAWKSVTFSVPESTFPPDLVLLAASCASPTNTCLMVSQGAPVTLSLTGVPSGMSLYLIVSGRAASDAGLFTLEVTGTPN